MDELIHSAIEFLATCAALELVEHSVNPDVNSNEIDSIGATLPEVDMRLLSIACVAVLAAPGSDALAQTTLRFSHFVPPTHATFGGLKQWASSLEGASGGRLSVKVFPAEQLGKAKDHYDMVRDGIADAGWVVPGYTPGRFPVVGLLELPFMVSNADSGSLAFDTWYRRYAATELKDVHYCLGFLQEPGVLHTRKPVRQPEDLRGMKLRSPTVPMSDFFSSLGVNSVAIPAPQVREAVERGTIDGAAFAWSTAVTLGVAKATPFHLDAPIYTVPVVYLLNKTFYERQGPEVRRAIDAHCTSQWAQRIGADWAAQEKAGRATLQADREHTIMKMSENDVRAWRSAAQPLSVQWRQSVLKTGVDPDAARSGLLELLQRYGAGY